MKIEIEAEATQEEMAEILYGAITSYSNGLIPAEFDPLHLETTYRIIHEMLVSIQLLR